jgi:branched-chain amino acid transport system substrate-binding protein
MVANLTGAGSENGTTVKSGAEVAIDQVNEAGGIMGCPIEMKTVDDGSDYTQTLPLLQKATSEEQYSMVMSMDFGCVTTAPYITREKLLSLSACAQTHFANSENPTIFDTDYVAARPAMVAVKHLLDEGQKKIALLVDNTQLGADDIAAVTPIIEENGGTITDTERLSEEGVNFSSAVQRAKASDPEAVFSDMFGAAAGHLKTDINAAGWEVPRAGGQSETATSFEQLKVPLSLLKNTTLVGSASMALPSTPLREEFIEELEAHGVDIKTFMFAYAAAHDDITLFAWAANQTESLDAETIAQKLHETGEVKVPGLVQGETTGYTSESGEWNAKEGVAVLKAGYYNKGRLPSIEITEAPPLPSSE